MLQLQLAIVGRYCSDSLNQRYNNDIVALQTCNPSIDAVTISCIHWILSNSICHFGGFD